MWVPPIKVNNNGFICHRGGTGLGHRILLGRLWLSSEQLELIVFVWAGFCGGKCKMRCSKASVQDRCLLYCGLCCQQCKCVPSGTYGNKDECPCYRDKYTGVGRKRRPKCP
ncbi:peamaclein-like [Iris pallida]|uniref:Peamaclein-like n=1 Tax=Iris pallida TaxID=29817 RepID=A0AAX6II92_IRIPA|nr:peamaclein-like [Iris pallida]